MKKSNISWEIVLAGVTFIAIGIYLFNRTTSDSTSSSSATVWHSDTHAPNPPEPSLPGAIVIDLQNLENLKNIENLKNLSNIKNLENLKELEIEIKNLDKLIEKHAREDVQKNLDENLKELETELQKLEQADFNVKLQNQKLFINKNYNVTDATWTEIDSGVYVFRETFSTSDLRSMDLNLSFGNIIIVGNGNQKGEITLRATGKIEDPANLSEQMNIQKSLVDSEATFNVSSKDDSNISNRINLEATLVLPQNVKLTANTSGGHINASNMTNKQHLETSGGHISLHDIAGKTMAKTAGGHITTDHISGNTSLSTGGGHIKVQKSSGSLTAKTSGGHIEIQNALGSVFAKTSGGNISSTIQEADGPLKFFTSAGNVSLYVPTNIAADLDITASDVSLAESFNFDGTKNRRSVNGTINGGGIPLVVNCGYGNVTISSNQ